MSAGPNEAGSNRPIAVRPTTADDFPAVEALLVAVYPGGRYSDPAIEPWLRDVAAHAAAAELLVAVDGVTQEILGSVCFMPAGNGFAQIARDGEAEFRLLAVAPAARGRGAGEAPVRGCIELAQERGCAQLVLSTQPTMLAAQRLYERRGFVREPGRDWQTDAGSRRIVYARRL